MALSPEQITTLRAAAEREGVDPDALIAAADPGASGADRRDTGSAPTTTEPPKLFHFSTTCPSSSSANCARSGSASTSGLPTTKCSAPSSR